MTREIAGRLRLHAIVLVLGVVGAASLRGQDPRDALVARAFNEFDAARRLQLLMSALNPTAGPPRGAWPVGVQLLAQTLIEDGQDSLAGAWLRWAVRLSPDLQPDTVQFLPRVIAAYRSARDVVLRTRTPGDTYAATTWLWPAQETGERVGRLQVSSATVGVPVRAFVEGVGLIGAGGSAPVAPGSYTVSVSAPGYDSVRVTREVLPGVTTVLDFRLRSALAQAAPPPQAAPAAPTPVAAPPRRKVFPVVLAVVGAGGAAAAAVILVAGKGGGGSTVTTGSITVTFPSNP